MGTHVALSVVLNKEFAFKKLFTTIRIIPLIINNSVEDNLMDKEQRLEKVENREIMQIRKQLEGL
jgi:hypothetical protein